MAMLLPITLIKMIDKRYKTHYIENGNPNTSMAAWVSVLSVLGLLDNFKDICDLKNDEMGIILEDENLPKRVRYKKAHYELSAAKSVDL